MFIEQYMRKLIAMTCTAQKNLWHNNYCVTVYHNICSVMQRSTLCFQSWLPICSSYSSLLLKVRDQTLPSMRSSFIVSLSGTYHSLRGALSSLDPNSAATTKFRHLLTKYPLLTLHYASLNFHLSGDITVSLQRR